MDPVVVVRGVAKVFDDPKRGVVEALKDVSFECRPGRIFGLLGPNGAGKTTMLRILATTLSPTRGSIVIDGVDVASDPQRARRRMGFLSGVAGLYERSTARELVGFFGELHGMTPASIRERIDVLASLLSMGSFLDMPCGKLSDGQRQKVRLARVLVHDPPVLILDEATATLDVLVADEVMRFIESERARGKCIIFSTHVMGEVERLCDDILVVHRGAVLFGGTREALAGGGRVADAFLALLRSAAAADAASAERAR